MAQNQINFKIGFQTDKTGLQELQSILGQITAQAQNANAGSKLNESLKQAGQTAKQLSDILDKSMNVDLGTINITKFTQGLKNANLTVSQLKTDLSAAGAVGATAFNTISSSILNTKMQIKETSVWLDKMATTMGNTIRWSITSTIINTITGSIQKAVGYTEDLNTSLNDIRIVTEKSADSMTKFAKEANAAAKALGSSTLDYTEASLIYYQQGLSDSEAKARAETTIKAANVTGQSAQTVSEQLTAVWNGYKVSSQEAELYVDKLAAVAARTAADLEELSTGMSKVASAANSMGVDVDQLNAQLATIVSVTRQAPESVGTALKTIYARMGDLKVDGQDEFGVSLGEVSGTLESLGVDILEMNGELRDMGEVMTEVGEKWNTWNDAQQQAIAISMAGKRQYNNLIALFENWDMYSDSLETSANSMGTLQKQQDIYMQSTEAKLKTLKSTWEDLYSGLILDDEKNWGIEALTDVVKIFDRFIDSFGGGIKSITAFGAIVANIFNKQIGGAIARVVANKEKFQNNLMMLQFQQEIATEGIATATKKGKISITDEVELARAQAQVPYAQQISKLGSSLTSEQYNDLIAQQEKIGDLAATEKSLRIAANQALKDSIKDATILADIQKRLGNTDALATYEEDAESRFSQIKEENANIIKQAEAERVLIDKQIASIMNARKSSIEKEAKSLAFFYDETAAKEGKGLLSTEQNAELNYLASGAASNQTKQAKLLNQLEQELASALNRELTTRQELANAAKNTYNEQLKQQQSQEKSLEQTRKDLSLEQQTLEVLQKQKAFLESSAYTTQNSGRVFDLLGRDKSKGPEINYTQYMTEDERTFVSSIASQRGAITQDQLDKVREIEAKISAEIQRQIDLRNTNIQNINKQIQDSESQLIKQKELVEQLLRKVQIAEANLQESMNKQAAFQEGQASDNLQFKANKYKTAGAGLLNEEQIKTLSLIEEGLLSQDAALEKIKKIEAQILKGLNEELTTRKNIASTARNATDVAEQELQAIKKATAAARAHGKEMDKAAEAARQQAIATKQINDNIQKAAKTSAIQNTITTLTSFTSSLSTSIMAVSSTIDIITDENLNGIDKFTQLLASIIPTAMMAVGGLKQLHTATTALRTGTLAANTAQASNVIITKLQTEATTGNRTAQFLLSKSLDTQIRLLDKMSDEQLANIGLSKLEVENLKKQKVAQDNFNASALKNPYLWIAIAVIAAITAITVAIKAQEKAQEEALKAADRRIEQSKELVSEAEEEANAIQQLISSYKGLTDQYDAGNTSLQALRISIHSLLTEYGYTELAVKSLSASYEELQNIMLDMEKLSAENRIGEINLLISDIERKITTLEKATNIFSNDSFNSIITGQYTMGVDDSNWWAWNKNRQITEKYIEDAITSRYKGVSYIPGTTQTSPIITATQEALDNIFANEKTAQEFLNALAEVGDISKLEEYYTTIQERNATRNQLIELQKTSLGYSEYRYGDIVSTETFIQEWDRLKDRAKNELQLTEEDANKWAYEFLSSLEGMSEFAFEASIQENVELIFKDPESEELYNWLKNQATQEEKQYAVNMVGGNDVSADYAQAYGKYQTLQNAQGSIEILPQILDTLSSGKEVSDADWNALLGYLTKEEKEELENASSIFEKIQILTRIGTESASEIYGLVNDEVIDNYSKALDAEKEKFADRTATKINFDSNISRTDEDGNEIILSSLFEGVKTRQDLVTRYNEEKAILDKKIKEIQSDSSLTAAEQYSQIQSLQTEFDINFGWMTGPTQEDMISLLQTKWGIQDRTTAENIIKSLFGEYTLNDIKVGIDFVAQTVDNQEFNLDELTLDKAKAQTQQINSELQVYKNIQEVIQDGLIVSQEDIQMIASTMPELLNGMTDLGNGSIKLNQDVYNDFLTNTKSYIGTINTLIEDYSQKMKVAYESGETALGAQYSILIATLSGWKSYAENADKAIDSIKELYNELDHIEKKIDILNHKTERLTSSLEKMSGAAFKANYKSVNKELEKQIDLYQQLEKEYENEYRRQQINVLGYGFIVSPEGIIQNYSDIMNNLSEDQQQNAEKTVDAYYEAFNGFYDAQDRRIEIMNQQIENKLKAFNIDIEITTNIDEVRDAILELNKILLDDDDIIGLTTANVSSLDEKYNTLSSQSTNIQNIRNEIEKINNGQESVYSYIDPATGARVNDLSAAYEALKENTDSMVSTLGSIKDLSQEINESYIDLLDQAQEQFDAYINSLEQLDGFLNHRLQVIELLQGEEAYDSFDNIYNLQKQNLLQEKKSYEDQMAFYEARIEETKGVNEEAYKEAISKWQEAASGWQNVVEASIEVIQNDYSNAIKNIFKSLENELSNNLGFKAISEEWESIKSDSKEYLDTVNRAYEIEKISMKFRKAIDQTDNIKAQAKLQKTMEDEEMALLEKKDKLSQYDVDRADLKYQITLKQLALEDQMQAKTKMRLTRDANGGYSYKFVADESATENLESEILDLENQLYNLDKDKYEKNLDSIYALYQEFAEKVQEVLNDNSLTEEEKQTKLYNLRNEYQDKFIIKAKENTDIQKNLIDSVGYTMDDLMSTTGKDIETILKESIPGLTSGMQGMANRLTEDGGFYSILDNAFIELEKACTDFAGELEALELDTTYNTIATNIANIINATDPMLTAIDEQFKALKPLLKRVQDIETAWAGALDSARKIAAESYGEYKDGIGKNPGNNSDSLLDDPKSINNAKRWTDYSQIDQEIIDKYNIMSEEKFNKSKISGDVTGSNIDKASANEANQYYNYQAYLDDKYYQVMNKSSIDDRGQETLSYDAPLILTENSTNPENANYFRFNERTWTTTPGVGKHPVPQEMQPTKNTARFAQNQYVKAKTTSSGYIPVAYYANSDAWLFNANNLEDTIFEVLNSTIYENGHDRYVQAKIIDYGEATDLRFEASPIYLPISGLEAAKNPNPSPNPSPSPNLNPKLFQKYDTGGYTGVWGSSEGRMAMLHEKELVLNKMDTANILSAVSMVRDIASALTASVNLHIADKMSRILSASDFEQAETTPMEQNVHIEAHFPNVNNSKEIEEAFDNLVLRATQAALKNPFR